MKQLKFIFVAMVGLVLSLPAMAVNRVNRFETKHAISTPEMRKRADWGLAGEAQKKRQQKQLAEVGIPSDTIVTQGFGFLQGPDDLDWLFTEDVTFGGRFGDEIKKSTFTIYDASRNIVGTISHTIDSDKSVNALYPYGVITTNFFDNNSSTYEVLVYEHELLGEGITAEKVYVYNTNGEKVTEFDGGQVAIYHIQQTSWDSYDRMLLMQNTRHEGEYVHRIDICKRKGYSETNEVEHTFIVPEANVIGHVGPFFNTYEIDNKPYYVISQYEKPFFTGEWDMNTGQQFETQDNSFIVTVYNEDFEVAEEIRIPCEKPAQKCVMYGFGFLTYEDLSKGFYSNDDEFNFVVTIDKYDMMKDEDKFTFDVYDGKSHKIKTIDSDIDAEGIMQLADVRGHESQWAFGHTETNSDNETMSFIRLVNVPSCQVAATVVPTLDLPISFEMNRCAKGNDYQYVTSFSDAELDADDNVYAVVGWFNSDLTLDRKVKFNLGTTGLMAKFNFTSTALNPFLLDADDELEYFYLSNISRTDGSGKTDTYLNIADHEGKTIKSYVGNNEKGAILTVGFLNPQTEDRVMYIGCRTDSYKYTLEFIGLPFEQAPSLQGAGTAENPYLISTWADLQQIKNYPTAHFKQINDIDMSITGESWEAIPRFSGTYDGGNFKLRNMYVANPTADHLAFFGEVSEATIRNMIFTGATVEVGANNPYAAVVASYVVASTIENVHVYNAEIIANSNEADPIVGGVVATTSFEGKMTACSFNDGVIKVPGAQVGGIAGSARTGIAIAACAVSGTIVGNEYVGGIAGEQGMNVTIQNCHVDAHIKGISSLGGLVGWNADRATITNNIVEGTLESLEASRWGARLGGVVGTLAEDWNASKTKIIKSNVVLLDTIIVPASDTTVHGIVGFSSENAVLDPDESFHPENGLDSNYVSLAAYAGKLDNVGGQLIGADTLTQPFFQSIHFAYGNTVTAPWVNTTIPTLFGQPDSLKTIPATGIRLNTTAAQFFTGTTYELIATFTPADATTRDVTWTTTDAAIATVENGIVKGIAAGKATITATTTDGQYKASCEVTIVETVTITGLTLDTVNLTLYAGDVHHLVAKLLPADATYQAVVWTSADEKVARVEDGWVIAVAKGQTVITVATQDGRFTATCNVTVKEIPVLGVMLDLSEVDLFVGSVRQLNATINPEDATNKKLIWSTADENIAIVDNNGMIFALAKGQTVITVTTKDGGFTATCNVTVKDDTAVDNIEINGAVNVRKVLHKDTIYIIRDGEIYTILGNRVK